MSTQTLEWTVERHDPAEGSLWDGLVRGARQRHFLFERAYMDYHADRFEDASLVLLHRGAPAALLPLSRHGDEVVSHGGLTFGGILSGPELTTVRTCEALDAAAAALAADGVRRLVYKPVPHLYHLAPAEEDLFWLASRDGRLLRRDVSAALRPGDAPAYSSERRRAVRRGLAAGLELSESTAFEEYLELVRTILRARHDAEPVHTAAELRLLADRFPESIRLFAARDAGGELLAGVLVYETPVVAHAQYIACSDRGRELRAQDALFDHLLRDTYADRRWFDFGTSMERDGALNDGLVRNKEGFGARAVAYDRWVVGL